MPVSELHAGTWQTDSLSKLQYVYGILGCARHAPAVKIFCIDNFAHTSPYHRVVGTPSDFFYCWINFWVSFEEKTFSPYPVSQKYASFAPNLYLFVACATSQVGYLATIILPKRTYTCCHYFVQKAIPIFLSKNKKPPEYCNDNVQSI